MAIYELAKPKMPIADVNILPFSLTLSRQETTIASGTGHV